MSGFADLMSSTTGFPMRDKWQRPMLKCSDGVTRPFVRMSSLGGKISTDKSALERWKVRVTLRGALRNKATLADTPDDLPDDVLDKVAYALFEEGGGHDAANRGTAIHAVIEAQLNGWNLPEGTTREDLADAAAYHELARELDWHCEQTERFVAYESIGVTHSGGRWQVGGFAGTADQYGRFMGADRTGLPQGLIVGDYKTGSHAPSDFSGLDYSFQLGGYAHSRVPHANGTWSDIGGGPVNRQQAVIWHIPRGSGTCQLYIVDVSRFLEQAAVLSMVESAQRVGKKLIKVWEQ